MEYRNIMNGIIKKAHKTQLMSKCFHQNTFSSTDSKIVQELVHK